MKQKLSMGGGGYLYSRFGETGGNGDNDYQDENKENYSSNAHTSPAALLILLCSLEVLSSIINILSCIHYMMFNVIHFLSLCLNHHCHVQEYLVKLKQALFDLLCCVMTVLYLHHCFQHFPPTMLLHQSKSSTT